MMETSWQLFEPSLSFVLQTTELATALRRGKEAENVISHIPLQLP